MSEFLNTEIKFLTGVGSKRAELLQNELNIFTFEDLLWYFPYRYVDRSKFYKIDELTSEIPYVQVKGRFIKFETIGENRARRLIAYFSDGSGVIELVFFQGIKWMKESLKINTEYIIFGKPSFFNGKINIIHPEIEELAKQEKKPGSALQPLYNTTEKLKNSFLNSRGMSKLLSNLILLIKAPISETLPEYLTANYKLLSLHESLINIHFPASVEILQSARYRLKFEELFFVQLKIQIQKKFRTEKQQGHIIEKKDSYNMQFWKNRPFDYTGAQIRVLKEIRKNMISGKQMSRLLQGDVGSGKTLVAIVSMLMVIDNGFQACLMVPTEILAIQHYNTITKYLQPFGLNVKLLTGSTKKKNRTILSEELENGTLNILIGTHAIIEDNVKFSNLGLAIIDEQHRFGVAQRKKIWDKNVIPPHILVMTATPIPRTLQMTVYGDLDVSVIDELPPGRQNICTKHYTDALRLRVFGEIKNEIKKGRQIYIVYPLIKESEKFDYKFLEDGVESILRAFPPPEYSMVVVHGKQKNENKEESMRQFVAGKADILIATTVIEVGVDVPNATMMIIESAERFGLSQLHQLRGRVGRGGEKSTCILMTAENISSEAKIRMQTMCESNDGFHIAEVDLQLRGPGDIEGTHQSGLPTEFKIANLAKDGQLIQFVKTIAEEILDKDLALEKPENILLIKKLKSMKKDDEHWENIG